MMIPTRRVMVSRRVEFLFIRQACKRRGAPSAATPQSRQRRGQHERNDKRGQYRNGGPDGKRPGGEMLTRRLSVNPRRDRETEGPEAGGQRYAECCCRGRATEPGQLITDVARERSGADYPCREPPRDARLMGRGVAGERAEHEARD